MWPWLNMSQSILSTTIAHVVLIDKSIGLVNVGGVTMAQANQGHLHHIPCKLHSHSHPSCPPLHHGPSSHVHYHAHEAQPPINAYHSQSTWTIVTLTLLDALMSKFQFKTLLWHKIAISQAKAVPNGDPLISFPFHTSRRYAWPSSQLHIDFIASSHKHATQTSKRTPKHHIRYNGKFSWFWENTV